MRCFTRTALVATALISASCGDDGADRIAPPTKPIRVQAVDADLLSLLPSDCAGVIYVPSLRSLEDGVRSIVERVAPQQARIVQLGMIEAVLPGVRLNDLDLDKPAAVALRFVAQKTKPVFVFAAKDAADLADVADGETAVAGSFVSISETPVVTDGGPPSFVADLQAGVVSVRFDMARCRKRLADFEREFMAELRLMGPHAAPAIAVYQWLFDALRGDVQRVDAALSVDGDSTRLTAAVDVGRPLDLAAEGSAGLGALLGTIASEPDDVMLFGYDGDWGKFNALFAPVMQEMIEQVTLADQQVGQDYEKMFAAQAELYAAFSGPSVGRVELADRGMSGLLVGEPSSPDDAVREVREFFTDAFGMAMFGKPELGQVDAAGTTFDTVEFELDTSSIREMAGGNAGGPDPEKMLRAIYGDKIAMRTARVDDRVVFKFGGTDADLADCVAAARSGDRPAKAVRAALARSDAKPYAFAGFNLAAGLRGFSAALGADSPIPEIAPEVQSWVWFSVSQHGGRHVLDIHADIGGIAALVR